jgi:hypothetical protein
LGLSWTSSDFVCHSAHILRAVWFNISSFGWRWFTFRDHYFFDSKASRESSRSANASLIWHRMAKSGNDRMLPMNGFVMISKHRGFVQQMMRFGLNPTSFWCNIEWLKDLFMGMNGLKLIRDVEILIWERGLQRRCPSNSNSVNRAESRGKSFLCIDCFWNIWGFQWIIAYPNSKKKNLSKDVLYILNETWGSFITRVSRQPILLFL